MPDEQTLQRLERGEIILYETRTDESGGAGRVQALVHAPAADVWAVIISCEQAFLFVDGLKSCEVLEDSGDRARVHQVVKKHWLLPTQDFVFLSLRKPYREIDFELLEGNLDVLEGSWRFTPLPQGLLLEYEARHQGEHGLYRIVFAGLSETGPGSSPACRRPPGWCGAPFAGIPRT